MIRYDTNPQEWATQKAVCDSIKLPIALHLAYSCPDWYKAEFTKSPRRL